MKFPEIISGNRAGAERAAKEWAILNKVSHSGGQGIEQNMLRSGATVMFTLGAEPAEHAQIALSLGQHHKRRYLHIHSRARLPATMLESMVGHFRISKLHVCGSTEHQEPAIGQFVHQILDQTAALPKER